VIDIEQEIQAVQADLELIRKGEEAWWRIAERTYRCTLGAGDVHTERSLGKINMKEWCDRNGFSVTSGNYYKAIWQKYGLHPGGDRPSWTEAYADIRGGTVGERMVESDFKRALDHASPEQVASVVKQIVRDHQSALEIAIDDNETRYAIQRAESARAQRIYGPIQNHLTREVTDSAWDRWQFLIDMGHKLDLWSGELNYVVPFLSQTENVDYGHRQAAYLKLARLVEAAIACRDAIPGAPFPDVITQVQEVLAALQAEST